MKNVCTIMTSVLPCLRKSYKGVNMKEKFAKLIDVKSIVTLTLTAVVAYRSLTGQFDVREIYLLIIGFYFGTQSEKKKELG